MTNQTSTYNISKYDSNYDSAKAIRAHILKLQAQESAKAKARAIASETEAARVERNKRIFASITNRL